MEALDISDLVGPVASDENEEPNWVSKFRYSLGDDLDQIDLHIDIVELVKPINNNQSC